MRWAYAAVGSAAVVAGAVAVASPASRAWARRALAHTVREPVYVDRMLSRLAALDGAWSLGDEESDHDQTRRFVRQIMSRYDIGSPTLGPRWSAPPPPPSWSEGLAALGAEVPDDGFHVVVYYVDTLRYDAATDPAIMPHLVELAGQSLHFRSAYSSASDTVEAMPALLTGRYEPDEDDADLLTVAHESRVDSTAFIPLSAYRFLSKHCPRFRLDDAVVIRDYLEGKKVWGYGGDQPTASRIVDAALEALGNLDATPRLLWLFHFDLHAWRELDKQYVYDAAARLGVPDEAPLNWRYRVVARTVDEQLGRLLAGIDELGLTERTIVLVLSDHGEALGRHGFWVHGIFLWESLVHVPLVLRVPGVVPRVVDRPVGHVDLFPTLAPLLDESVSLARSHGDPLWEAARSDGRLRRLPLLLRSMRKEDLLRIGLVDGSEPRKLVLPLETGVPELYDLATVEPDDLDIAERERTTALRMLSELVRSPSFPRPPAPPPEAK
ncbi:MAG: sulfatase-like hydrolase/transferase [Deltaproteobacteria bacterium]|nr:sulfatase-like hydrolase/transferase [Deltaproteobacteria bacterium]MBW2534155.1 sulfatase-like hydrolase/transferase [Deltaproteobacteria bacterium]